MRDNKTIPEIFDAVRAAEGSVDDKAQVLKMYDRKDLRFVVDFMYNGNKDGLYVPEYTPSSKPVGMNYMTIGTALKQIEAALQYRTQIDVYERNVVRVLESVSADEAQLIADLFEGKKVEGISKAVFKRVYPAFFRQSDSEGV